MQAVRSEASAAFGALPGIVQPFYYFPIRFPISVLPEYLPYCICFILVDDKALVIYVVPKRRLPAVCFPCSAM